MAVSKKVTKSKKSSPPRTPARATSTTSKSKSASSGSGKTAVKKTAVKKSVPPVKKTSPRNTAPKSAPKKSAPAKGRVSKTTTKPASNRGGVNREMDEVTGFAVGTESLYIAQTLLEGGESRQEIIDTLREELEGETRNGTEKPVANLVSGVVNKLLARGFTIESSYRLVPPTVKSRGAKGSKRGGARK